MGGTWAHLTKVRGLFLEALNVLSKISGDIESLSKQWGWSTLTELFLC